MVKYLEKKFELNLEFIAPVVGNETDNFNTLVATGDYPDMMDLSFYAGTVSDLYDNGDGICLDLTQYIADYMPNYSAFLEANKTGATAYAAIDGKYLTLNNYNADVPNQWGGCFVEPVFCDVHDPSRCGTDPGLPCDRKTDPGIRLCFDG